MGKYTAINMHSMLQSRMGWNISDPKCPFEDVRCHPLDDERVVTVIVTRKDAFLLYDELPLFPSDALVTKIRLME